jgi:UPF0271 protein
MAVANTSLTIDLNADVGESTASDAVLMSHITSANIACGGHAGDARTMRAALLLARQHGVAAGAHPGYPDRANFGRVDMHIALPELELLLQGQIAALAREAVILNMKLRHVKAHGALYHAANRSSEIARAIARAALACGKDLILVGLAGSPALDTWRSMGARVASEAFADRVYDADGSLRSRTLPGALLFSAEAAAQQAVSIACQHRVKTQNGEMMPVTAQTLCLHSDTPGADGFAREVRRALEAAGCVLQPLA